MIKNATISLQTIRIEEDEEFNKIESVVWAMPIGCTIAHNSKANIVATNDGKDNVTSYEVLVSDMSVFHRIIRVGDTVRIKKYDLTVDVERKVLGVSTNRHWVKLWI